MNVPIGVAILVLAPISLPMGDRTRRRLDLPGAVLITASMTTLVYGLERAPSSGWWSSSTITWLVVAISLLALFVIVELRTVAPLVPLGFLRHRSRAAGYVMMLALGGAMLAVLYFLTQFLQESLHYSVLMAGVAYLPVPVTVGGMGVLVSRVVGRTGVRPFLTVGPLLVTGGMIWLSTLTAHSTYLVVFWPLVLIGLGQGCSFVPLTLNAVASVGESQAGLASGLLNTSQQLGSSVALAAIVSAAATADQALCRRSRATLGGHTGRSVQMAAAVHGFHVSMYGGAIAGLVAFLASLMLPRIERRARMDQELVEIVEVIDESL